MDLGRLTTGLSMVKFKIANGCPLRDMVKFRKSAVNAESRDQQVAIVGIFRATISTVFRLKARNSYDKYQ